jgi:acetyl esterase/lipase
MPSLQSRLFLFTLRHRHLLRFRLRRRASFDHNSSIAAYRREVSAPSRLFGGVPDGFEVAPVTIGNLYSEWIRPVPSTEAHTILYFHGGGYVAGTCQAHQAHVSKVVQGSGIRALLFEYRLAPEHPFPAALDDAIAAYRWLLAQGIRPGEIAFMGDSAGGGLALATLLALRDQGDPLPAAAVVLSPWTDLLCTGDSYRSKLAAEPLAPTGSWTVFSDYYVAGNDARHPWISPLYGDLRGLPPLRIYVGENEVLLDDSRRFAAKARQAGVAVTLTVGEGLFHCYPICAPLFPEATAAMVELCAFLREMTDDEASAALPPPLASRKQPAYNHLHDLLRPDRDAVAPCHRLQRGKF